MKSSLIGRRTVGLISALLASLALMASASAVPTPIHAFDFDGNYVDSVTGTVTITAQGGSLLGSRHEFNPQKPAPADVGSMFGAHNQGLTLTNPGLSNPGVYSIEMYLRYDTINNISDAFSDWLKLVDFKNGSESLGYYYVDSFRSPNGGGAPDTSSVFRFTYAPNFGPPLYKDSQPVMTPGAWVHLVLTRDAANQSAGYVNGQLAFTVDDSLLHGVFDGPGNVMRFFQGDLPAITDPTGPYYEVGKGGVDFLNVYNVALTPGDVATLAAAVPEPTAGVLVLVATIMAPALRRRLA